jgi:hypothetical protein
MVEYFRITGLNNILFDQAAAAANNRYRLVRGQSPKGIDKPLTKEEAIPFLRNIPTETKSHILGRPGEHVMSVITFPFSIQGTSDADMEDAEHDLRETLEDGKLYIKTKGARGTRAVLEMQSNNAAARSYKTVFWAEFVEDGGREILGAAIKESYIRDLQMRLMRLYLEAYWRPASTTNLINGVQLPTHDDTAHNNWLDIAAGNIVGDVDARVKLRVEYESSASSHPNDLMPLIRVARRTRGTVTNFQHQFEAEDATTQSNWPDSPAGDVTCSEGDKVIDSANAAGYIIISKAVNLLDNYGRFHVFARLKTDDIVNTKLRLSTGYVTLHDEIWQITQWKYLEVPDEWQLFDFGCFFIPPIFPITSGLNPNILYKLEYSKDAADTVECDYIAVLPEDEPISVSDCPNAYSPDAGDWFILDQSADFDYFAIETTGSFLYRATVRGSPLTLRPGVTNRLIFYPDAWDGTYRVNRADDAVLPMHMKVWVDYLPQFISPLE